METPNQSGVRKEVLKSAITVDSVEAGQYSKPGMEQAQLRQEVKTTSFYPSARISNNMSDNLFAQGEFTSLTEKEFPNTENRVAWIPVPEGTSVDNVVAKLAAVPDACIYRVLSNRPILHDGQKAAITAELKTEQDFAMSQVLRYPDGAKNKANEDISNQMILSQFGKIQYRANFFSATAKADVDLRNSDIDDQFIPEALQEEYQEAAEIMLKTAGITV